MRLSAPFWRALAERAVEAFAQSLLAVLTVTSGPLDVLHTDWRGALSIAAGATVLSVLRSVGAAGPQAVAMSRSAGRHEAP